MAWSLIKTSSAALPYEDIAPFTKALRDRGGISARALEFLLLTAARPGEVTNAQWDEINFDKAEWTVPGERMKSGVVHRVPLWQRHGVQHIGQAPQPVVQLAYDLFRGMSFPWHLDLLQTAQD